VKKIEMLLDRDEFLVTYDSAQADAKLLVATVKQAGYTARVVSGKKKAATLVVTTLPRGFPLLDAALAQAKNENKPIVLDLHAAWCAPCRRMERETFPDKRVKALLEQTVFLRIDTDEHPALAERLQVAGLPDIRLVLPDGTIIRQLRSFQFPGVFAQELRQLLQKVTPNPVRE
jgi:thiol:disulfide interchange protein